MEPNTPTVDDQKSSEAGSLLANLTATLRATAEQVVPWFLRNMPAAYFQDTDEPTRLAHLRAIVGAKAAGRPIEFTLRNDDDSEWTAVHPVNRPGVVAEQARLLPHDRHLRAARIHAAADNQLVLVTFEFGEAPKFDPEDARQKAKLEETIEYAAEYLPQWAPGQIRAFFSCCSAEYVLKLTPLRICQHWRLYDEIRDASGTRVLLEPEDDPRQCRITVVMTNVTTRRMIERLTTRLSFDGVNLQRAYLDVIDDGRGGRVVFFGFVVQGPDGERIVPESDLWKTLRYDLLRSKWLDHRTLDLAYRHPELGQRRAEVLTGLADLAHQVLIKSNPYAFKADRILRLIEQNMNQATKLADLFLARFDPRTPLTLKVYRARVEDLVTEIEDHVGVDDARIILRMMLDAIGAVQRTNVFLERRFALSMRIDPSFLRAEGREEMPFGVFFVHGRSFNGFHVRFRDIARGGVRLIQPRHPDIHAVEAERLYDEAYGLAAAQQLKNKDIPEGGSKAAVLLHPEAKIERSMKGFIDALLDLITPDPETRRHVVDYLGKDEFLYLGPDENILPEHIEWIVDRARRRGYASPNSFMSSKPGAGINHKVYGVTSEGVNVFLEVALRAVGIDPTRQRFTLKITGGPDGDVAGNMIRILQRDYGGNARVIGIADGSGCGEDPEGLDDAELMHLFQVAQPIAMFDRSKLSARGRLVSIDDPEGMKLRNALHNRVVADAFIPAGGRPHTIHEANWEQFLTPDGTPSAKVIIEGANLFITPEARRKLSDCGVLILKDSSANKCGVICSSYEIIASMLLTEPEFLEMKDAFVAEVIARLRALARQEAELLLRVRRHQRGVPLPEMSIRLSEGIIRTADAIETVITKLSPTDAEMFRKLVIEHVPPVLLEKVGERLWRDVPKAYLNSIMAKRLAAKIVYREGYRYFEAMPTEGIAEMAVHYVRMELERAALADEVLKSDLPNRARIAHLLLRSGILATLGEETVSADGGTVSR